MILLRQLFNLAEGGMSEESDTFKHMSAAFTVLRSLGSAQTATNKESSRIGHFIEVQVTDNVLNRTKIHCYFLDQVKKEKKNLHPFALFSSDLVSTVLWFQAAMCICLMKYVHFILFFVTANYLFKIS